MLRELRIRDFAIIDDLALSFRPGLERHHRRDRRRQEHHPAGAGAAVRRARRRRSDPQRRRRGLDRGPVRVRRARRAARGARARRRRDPGAPPSRPLRQEPRLRQRQPGHGRPAGAARRLAGAHLRPARAGASCCVQPVTSSCSTASPSSARSAGAWPTRTAPPRAARAHLERVEQRTARRSPNGATCSSSSTPS